MPNWMGKFGGGGTLAHKTTHQKSGSDEVSVADLAGVLTAEQKSSWAQLSGKPSTFTPAAHASSHQDTGSDEISIAALSGESADEQKSTWAKVSGKPSSFTPEGHHARHEEGGNDVVAGGAVYPWMIDIDCFHTPQSNLNWNTIAVDTGYYYNARMQSSSAKNDWIAWHVVLAAGTWTFELIHSASNDRGIYTVEFDGVTKGTIDGYVASSILKRDSITGIVVSVTAKIALKLIMATTNPSSGYYQGTIMHARLTRTA